MRHKVSLGALYVYAALLHRLQVGSASQQSDIETGPGHACAEIGSNGTGSRDQESHGSISKLIIHADPKMPQRLRAGESSQSKWLEYFLPERSSRDIYSPPATLGSD